MRTQTRAFVLGLATIVVFGLICYAATPAQWLKDGLPASSAALTAASGKIPVGNGTAYAECSVSGDATLASGGAVTVLKADNTALLKNNADNTKLGIFSLSNLTTATTRTWTMIDANGSIPIGPTAGPITFAGPTTGRTWTGPDASATLLTSANLVTVAQGGTGTSNGSITGTGALTFAATGAGNTITLTPNSSGTVNVISDATPQITIKGAANGNEQLLLGYSPGLARGFIQAVLQGTAYEPLWLSASGGGIQIGQAGTLGTITLGNATSGTILLTPVAGALGSTTLTMPATTGTLITSGDVGTLTTAMHANGAITTAKMDVTNDGGSVNQWENLFDNPQGIVTQRASVTYTPGAGGGAYFYGQADRWKGTGTAGTSQTTTIAVNTSATAGRTGNAVEITSTLSGTGGIVFLAQAIESKSALKLRNRNASISASVWQDTGSTQTYTIAVYRCSSTADNWGANFVNQTLIGSTTASVSNNTATTISLANQAMAETKTGVLVIFSVACGNVTAKHFQFSDLQIQAGPTVTPCEVRPYQVELARCQRMYCRSYSQGTALNTSAVQGFASATCPATNVLNSNICFPQTMRAVPTVHTISYNGTNDKVGLASTGADVGTTTIAAPNDRGLVQVTDATNPYTVGTTYVFHWYADADF